MRIFGMVACPLLLAALLCGPQASFQSKAQTAEAVKDFVQQFYAWYVPVALQAADHYQPGWTVALKERGSAFSRDLKLALTEDQEAQAKVSGYIVGLDFDPFLAAQDPCERYVVGEATRKADHYLVPVYGVCSGKRHAKPDAVAEVGRMGRSWVFLDFDYPGNPPGLLGTLKLLREERAKHPKK